MGSRGGSIGNSKIPRGWRIVDYVEGIAVLRPNDPVKSLSLPTQSNIPGISYLLYGRDGIFKQLRIFGKDNQPLEDIDYHRVNGTMSLHKHTYARGVRQKDHINLTDEENRKYSKFLEKVMR